MAMPNDNLYEFDHFRLDLAEKMLTRDGATVPLTPKAFDTLVLLVEKSGRLVEKDELMNRLWPDTLVEENSLSQNVYLVRKALGEESQGPRYIETVPRRGYRFTAPVRKVSGGGAMTEEDSGAHTLVEGNGSPAGALTMAGALSPLLRRFSSASLLALAPAITLLAVWLIWSAPRRFPRPSPRPSMDERKHLTMTRRRIALRERSKPSRTIFNRSSRS